MRTHLLTAAVRYAALALFAGTVSVPGLASAELIRHEGYRNDGTRIAGSVTVGGERTEIGESRSGSWTRVNAWTWSHVDERGNVDGTSVTDPAKVAAGHWERSGEELRWRLPDGSPAVGLIRVPAPDGSGDMQWSYGRPDGEIVRGTFCITEGGASHTYIADGSGRLLMDGTGWVRVPKITSGKGTKGVGVYYTDGTHAAVSGLFSVSGKAYYAPPELGYANFGKAERDGWLMLSDDDGALPSHEGWFGPGADKGGEMHYVTHMGDVDGIPVYAERSDGASGLPAQAMLPVLDGRRYLVCEREDLPSGFVTKGGKTCYFDPKTHKAVKGVQAIDGRVYCFDEADGSMRRSCWQEADDGSWYWLGDDGAAIGGWKLINEKWYYFDPKTYKTLKGVQTIDGKVYYLDESDCSMHRSCWQKADDGSWYWLGGDGAAVGGWKLIKKKWYYFDKKTFRTVRWTQVIDGKTYYFDGSYAMHTGWLQWVSGANKNKWSYFDKSGAMVFGKQTVDGVAYDFGKSGCVTRVTQWSKVSGKWAFFSGEKQVKWSYDDTDYKGRHRDYAESCYNTWQRISNMTSPTDYLLGCDYDNCFVHVFKRSSEGWVPVYSWICCMGSARGYGDVYYRPSGSTPIGTFKMTGSKSVAKNQPEAGYAVEFTRINWRGDRGCHFHTDVSYGRSKIASGRHTSPGGCIILPKSTEAKLYNLASKNTAVCVWTSKPDHASSHKGKKYYTVDWK